MAVKAMRELLLDNCVYGVHLQTLRYRNKCNVHPRRTRYLAGTVLAGCHRCIVPRAGSGVVPYLTYGEGVLPPSAEASSGPNAHPRINR